MNIRVDSLTKAFGDTVLFDNVSFGIRQGGITAFIGVSGCGKTKLMRIISCLDKDFDVRISGVPERISFLFQEDRLLPWYNVKDNIAFALKDVMDKREIQKTVAAVIKDVRLDGHETKRPSELSGGMQRRVAMARAFCYPSGLLLMDEPFKGFDAKLNHELIALFLKIYEGSGKTVIIVAHETELLKRLPVCDVIDVEALSRKR